MTQTTRDAYNQYSPTKANDQGTELVQIVIDFMRTHRNCFNTTEATNIGNEIINILNGTHKV